MQDNLPLCREYHKLSKIIVRSDQVADEVDLGGDDIDGRDVQLQDVSFYTKGLTAASRIG